MRSLLLKRTTALLCFVTLASVFASSITLAAGKDLAVAKPESVGMSSERLNRLSAGMKDLVDEGRVSGIVTIVAHKGKIVHFNAVGKRDIEANAPMQKDDIFRIYSMSKPITGAAMMILFEQGKWQLNDPVAKYIPEFKDLKVYSGAGADGKPELKPQGHPMLMRELMSHTAGFTYGFFSDTPVDKLQRDADVLNIDNTLDEFIKRMAKLPLNAQPGSEWHYSVSVDVQGYLVQKLSGMPFEEFLDKNIFKPLKMVDTAFYVPADKMNRLAQVYNYDKQGKLQPENGGFNHDFSKKPALPSGGGGLVSTASDYLRFCQMLQNGGELDGVRILSPKTVELMHTNALPANLPVMAPGTQFGLDFAIYTDPMTVGGYYGKGTYYWGGAAGTWFWIDPVNDVIVIGMIQHLGGASAANIAGLPDLRGLSHTYVYQSMLD